MDKRGLFKKVLETLSLEAQKMEETLGLVHKGINDAPGAMQSHSDTTRFQASGVAKEQTSSLRERNEAYKQIAFFVSGNDDHPCQIVCLGAVVEIREGNATNRYIILPAGGGEEVEYDNQLYIITTPNAPLIQHLTGKGAGATDTVMVRNRPRSVEILSVV